MSIHSSIVRIIAEATSPAGALQAVAEAVAADQGASACGVFLRRRSGGLVLWARFGQGLDERTWDAAATVAGEALARVLPAATAGAMRAISAAPLFSHALPNGALVVERAGSRPFSADETRRLADAASQIEGVVESARAIEALHGDSEPLSGVHAPAQGGPAGGEIALVGTAAAPGIAVGAAVFRQAFPRELVLRDTSARGESGERERLRDALEKTRNDLARLEAMTEAELGEEHALIFGSHRLLLMDPMIQKLIEQGIGAGQPAATAVDRALAEMAMRLRNAGDPSVQDRVEDVEDLRSRLLGHLLGAEQTQPVSTSIVVSRRMTPSLVVELKARGVLGIVSEIGGTTSHGAVLARALGVPAVSGIPDLLERVLAGDLIALDGDEGRVVLRPTARTLDEHRIRSEAAERLLTEHLTYRSRAPETADGVRFTLQANVALAADLEVARENGAEGIGLYRTELAFIVCEGIPTLEEQIHIYEKAYRAFPDGPIAFRILDLAGDKLLPGTGRGIASNAFHGYRSLRVLFDYPHILRDQARAFAMAAGPRPLSILVPMVTSVEEIRRVKEIITAVLAVHPETAGLPRPRFGAMIEVPGAVEIAEDLAKEVDFFSIGTNDLVQYALVIDREDARLSTPHDAFHPAILRMIRRVVGAAHAAGKKVSVCGEMAARPELAIALLALDIDALSVTPRLIPALKRRLASVPVRPLRSAIGPILALPTAAELEQALRAYMAEHPTP